MVGSCTDIHVRRGGNMRSVKPFVLYLLIVCI